MKQTILRKICRGNINGGLQFVLLEREVGRILAVTFLNT